MIKYPLIYNGTIIGTMLIFIFHNHIDADFVSLNLSGVKEWIGCSSFNWYQECISDLYPPYDTLGNRINVPYIDPFPGGYSLEEDKDFIYWSDDTHYYWDMDSIKTTGKVGIYNIKNALEYNLNSTVLHFEDSPRLRKKNLLKFNTQLACVINKFEFISLTKFGWEVVNETVYVRVG